ncbi:radical SAM/SPASM domain-containing protein [Thermodesulfobacteriota bacterium]
MKTYPRNYYIRRIASQLSKQRPKAAVALAKTILPGKMNNFPNFLSVEVTNHCNLSCGTCPQSGLSDEKGYLSMALFRKVVDECRRYASLRSIIFTGFGEPLMHPRLMEMSRYIKALKIPYVRAYTNCTLLNQKKTDEILLNSGFDEITLSLNAADRETYEQITDRKDYERVTDNIEYFLRRKNELKVRYPFVNLQLLKLSGVPLYEKQFIEKWLPLLQPGDCVRIKTPHSYAGQVNDPRVNQTFNNLKRFPCGQLWTYLFMSWNGDVMPCCVDPSKKLKIGNLHDSSLKELWRSPGIAHLREMHMRREYHSLPLCSDCEIWWYFSWRALAANKIRNRVKALLHQAGECGTYRSL